MDNTYQLYSQIIFFVIFTIWGPLLLSFTSVTGYILGAALVYFLGDFTWTIGQATTALHLPDNMAIIMFGGGCYVDSEVFQTTK